MQVEARDTIVKPAVPIWAGDVSFRMTDFATRNAERAGVAHAIDFKTADALQRLAPADRGTIVMNPPYGERIDAKGRGSQAAERRARRARSRPARAHAGARTRGERPRGPGADAFARENPEAARRGPREAPQSSGGRESAVVGGERRRQRERFFAQLATHWKRHYSGWTAWVLSPDMKLPTAMRLKESRRVPMWNGPIECRLFRFDMVSGSARGGAQAAPPTATLDTERHVARQDRASRALRTPSTGARRGSFSECVPRTHDDPIERRPPCPSSSRPRCSPRSRCPPRSPPCRPAPPTCPASTPPTCTR